MIAKSWSTLDKSWANRRFKQILDSPSLIQAEIEQIALKHIKDWTGKAILKFPEFFRAKVNDSESVYAVQRIVSMLSYEPRSKHPNIAQTLHRDPIPDFIHEILETYHDRWPCPTFNETALSMWSQAKKTHIERAPRETLKATLERYLTDVWFIAVSIFLRYAWTEVHKLYIGKEVRQVKDVMGRLHKYVEPNFEEDIEALLVSRQNLPTVLKKGALFAVVAAGGVLAYKKLRAATSSPRKHLPPQIAHEHAAHIAAA